MANENPLVSVLMPAYNAEKYIKEAIESIIAQTYIYWELIVINDGSTDKTKDIILSYTDIRIKYFENEKNLGIVATRNNAVKMASGEYCAMLDADDVCYPNRFKKQVAFLAKHKNYGVCGSWARNSNNTLLKLPAHNADIQCSLLVQCPFVNSSVMIRTNLLKKFQYRNYSVAEDYDLWIRLSLHTKMANIPEYLVFYRIHENNTSSTQSQLLSSLAQDIFRKQLSNNLNIVPTDTEMRIHELLANVKPNAATLDVQFLTDLKRWIQKLWKANKQTGYYNHSDFASVLWFRWILACLFMNRFEKLLSLAIPLSPKAFWCLLIQLKGRI